MELMIIIQIKSKITLFINLLFSIIDILLHMTEFKLYFGKASTNEHEYYKTLNNEN